MLSSLCAGVAFEAAWGSKGPHHKHGHQKDGNNRLVHVVACISTGGHIKLGRGSTAVELLLEGPSRAVQSRSAIDERVHRATACGSSK